MSAEKLDGRPADAVLDHPQVAVDLPPTPDGGSFTAWQAHLSFACRTTLRDMADAPAFSATAEMYFLRHFILLQSSASHPHLMMRSGEDIARSGVDLLQICVLLEGHYEGHCGGQPYRARAGDISFIDYGQPFEFEASAFKMIALLVPRSALPPSLAERPLHGLVPDPQRPATRLLSQFMRESYATIRKLTQAEAFSAAAAILELADGLSHIQHGARAQSRPSDLDLFSRAQAAIERRLDDDELSANSLPQLLHVSRAALYNVFVPHGGVQAYIRERRLQRCYEILKTNDRANETIGAIAFSLGFRSEAHFSRTFKERFGLSPRHLRQASRDQGGNVSPSTAIGIAPNVIQMLGR